MRPGSPTVSWVVRAWQRLAAVAGATRGATAVEAAIALPVVVVLMAGVFEFGRYYWTQNAMQLAIEETGRWVMVTGTTSQTAVQNYLRERVLTPSPSAVSVAVHVSASGSVSYATITAQYTFTTIFGAIVSPLGNRQLITRVKVPIVS
jgi:Flp pilus assembly protein TadG